jgi:hypothetical protein
MNQKECDAAADALCSWFESQELSNDDGAIVMTRVISSMLVTNSKSHKELIYKVEAFNQMITVASESTWLIKAASDRNKPER